MLKACAAVLPLVLLFHTSCFAWCTESADRTISLSNEVPGSVPPCHGDPEQNEPKRSHTQTNCEDCVYLQVESKAVPNMVATGPMALFTEMPVIEFQQVTDSVKLEAILAQHPVSPPSRPVLRI